MKYWWIVWLALMAMNALTFFIWGMDKRRAERRERRISERDLLTFAAWGGIGGAYLGRWYFRHKSRKQSFSVKLHILALFQLALVIWLFTRS
jgi:uncharacterized membrane protein YsdA (DUF1294 family)